MNKSGFQLTDEVSLLLSLVPQIGISSVWYEGNPCNMHLMDLALVSTVQVEAILKAHHTYGTCRSCAREANHLCYAAVHHPL